MEFRVLGPLEVWDGGQQIALTRAKQRTLLALLVLRRGQVLTADRLVDELWGDAPPRSASNSLQNLVLLLRRSLGADLLLTRDSGYLLDVDSEQVDSARFERLVAEGTAEADEAERAERLRAGLSLWRGPVCHDGGDAPLIRAEAARLEELRVSTLEEAIDAELALGGHARLVAELEALVAEHPFRERLRRQLMLALYRAERQADALAVYRDARRLLRDELGLEPSDELQRLERGVLAHDPSLEIARPAHRPRVNLPTPLTRLIGRERELAEALELLGAQRLVTLVGAGGSGKTRLAIEIAAAVAHEFSDGVAWVPLQAIADPELVLPEVGHAVGATVGVADHLEQRQVLIVLDNFEHVLPAATAVANLLAAAPDLKVVATSREPLHLSGEHAFPVDPLEERDAVALFVERARAVDPHFDGDDAVAPICRRLDCLPLAVELAAARTKLLSPAALLERLSERLPLLTGGPRDAPGRHQTLRATIDWSYDLLDSAERAAVSRLSVFSGGFSPKAAAAVCAASLDDLGSLLDKSLLQPTPHGFTMFETVREYMLERLEASGDAEQLRRAHALWFLALAESIDRGPHVGRRLNWLAADHDNFRSALGWMLVQGEFELEVRLAASLHPYFEARGDFAEGLRWLEAGLRETNELTNAVRARAIYGCARLLDSQGRSLDADASYAEALSLFRLTLDTASVAETLNEMSGIALRLGDADKAEKLARESLDLARELDDRWTEASALHSAAMAAHYRGDRAYGRALDEKSLQIRRAIGDAVGASVSLVNLGWFDLVEGDHDRAAIRFEEALAFARETDDVESIAYALENLGLASLKLSDHNRASDLLAESLALASRLGDRRLAAECLAGLAAVAAINSDANRLARLWGASESLRGASSTLNEVEDWIRQRFVNTSRTELERRTFAAEQARGRAMSFEQAVRYALPESMPQYLPW